MEDDLFEEGEQWKPFFRLQKQLSAKARKLLQLVLSLEASFEIDEQEQTHPVHLMMQHISVASAKLSGAKMLYDVYHALMENAVLVKVNLTELKVQLFAAKEFYKGNREYLEVIKEEVEAFRLLFIQWVKTFDKTKDYPDEWHLFNDPADFPPDDSEEDFDPRDFLPGPDEVR
ncbi:hypothetical protein [Niabella drilacis]|uniref:Uncharacterized protein n=1 Tax=Niabella drilacis (strain DSM 25811 / CCM 8410 / CCUG 62505 / LMG 26954 / E90) TaxID=1285928 RepID=A0A1G6M014_NIADE|nr:hypothetical protein [Niabella drilacis]SDC48634.1 hypothetical protein SAMN04487894_102508 [Niabella drilacis]